MDSDMGMGIAMEMVNGQWSMVMHVEMGGRKE
jgi:hypothetical protein